MDKDYTSQVEKILQKIKEARRSKGFSHEYMAHLLDISVSAYNKLERNETTLSVERLLLISNVLELSLTEVFEIKTGDVLNQNFNENANAIGKIETYYQDNQEKIQKIEELYKLLIKEKDEKIAFLLQIIHKLEKDSLS